MKRLECSECGPVTGVWFWGHLERYHGMDFSNFDATSPRSHPTSRMFSVSATDEAYCLVFPGRGKKTRV